ncbi:MAG: protease modulator HflC [Steroidobacteraceae bacterium]|jgi:membrane protease subunit HflC|nr:protease modulator HflC [Steroidobacteraceae bacterium]
MNGRIGAIIGGLLAVAIVLSQTFFVVRQNEFAIVLQFRDVVRTDLEPGLHFKIPFINQVQKFERRVITRNFPAEQFLTSEGKILNVDFYVKWRIVDADRFFRATGGLEEAGANRLGEIVKDGLKGVIAQRTIQQVVAAERAEFINNIVKVAGQPVQQLGLQLVDVRVKRIDLPDDVTDSVFARMRQEFARQAAQLRAEGEEQAIRIRAEADRSRTEILSAAQRDAEKIRGEGDAAAAQIFARATAGNPEFFSFYRSMQAYRRALGREGDIMVLSPEGQFFRYMQQPGGGR